MKAAEDLARSVKIDEVEDGACETGVNPSQFAQQLVESARLLAVGETDGVRAARSCESNFSVAIETGHTYLFVHRRIIHSRLSPRVP